MTALIFTHPPDYRAASYTVRSLVKLGIRPVVAIDQHDPLLHIDGAKVIRTKAPRSGNLNGKPFIKEALELMLEHGDGRIGFKCDSDCLMQRTDWAEGREETAVGLGHAEHRSFYGFCYALRLDRIPDMIAAMGMLKDGYAHPEDVAIGMLADECGGSFKYENLTRENRLGAYKWDTKRSVDWWKNRYDALCFQRLQGRSRDDVVAKMKEFQ